MRTITFFRNIGDKKVPVIINYDDDMNIIEAERSLRTEAGIISQAFSAAQAVISESKASAKGKPPITPEVIQERLDICSGCDQFIKEKNKCTQCGCYMKFKVRLRSQHCPLKKW